LLVVGNTLLWWIGNLALFVVVAPVVLLFANRVLRPIMEIKAYADDVTEHADALLRAVQDANRLERTRDVAGQAAQAASRYGSALQRAL
jgi:hypothetical protein